MSFLKSKFNLCVFEIPKELKITQGEAFNKLQKNKFKDLQSSQEFGDGWSNVKDLFKDFTMEDTVAVNSVVGGYRYDRKRVPAALIRKMYNEKLKEQSKDGFLNKNEKKLLKEECKAQLLMQTLPTPKLVTWFWDIDNCHVYVDIKSKAVIDTFTTLFNKTFGVYPVIKDYGLEEEEIGSFLEFIWETYEDQNNYWIDQEVTFDIDKNTFKFNGPEIEEYLEEIGVFKKAKGIKNLNVGMKLGDSDYSITFNNKNMVLGIESLAKVEHEDIETAILDNQDRINSVISQIEKMVKQYAN